MFAIGRGFAVPKEGEMLAEVVEEMAKDGVSREYMPAHHDSVPAQEHESSGPQPAHDNVPLLANLN